MDKPTEDIQGPEDRLKVALSAQRTVEYELVPADLRTFYNYSNAEGVKKLRTRKRAIWGIGFLIGTVLCFGWIIVHNPDGPPHDPVAFLLLISGLVIGIRLLIPWFPKILPDSIGIQRFIANAKKAGIFQRQIATLEVPRFRAVSQQGETARNWEAFDKIGVHDDLLLLTFQETSFIIPRRAFATDEEFHSFAETARSYHRLARPDLYIKQSDA
jgi:hypothetical protein